MTEKDLIGAKIIEVDAHRWCVHLLMLWPDNRTEWVTFDGQGGLWSGIFFGTKAEHTEAIDGL